MHKAWVLVIAKAQRLGQAVHVTGLAAAALHGQTMWFVQRQNVIVAVDHAGLNHLGIRVRDAPLDLSRFVIGIGQGRHAHDLTDLKPGRGLDPPAFNAQLALAAHLFDAPLADMREQAAQPPVDPLVAVILLPR